MGNDTLGCRKEVRKVEEWNTKKMMVIGRVLCRENHVNMGFTDMTMKEKS